jgi:predicted O-linked N-acetylglucosamine transferase (SPINDLY family)
MIIGRLLRSWNAARYNRIGRHMLKARQPQKAERHFRQALALDPGSNAAQSNLGQALFDQGHLREAEALFLDALKAEPSDPVTHNRAGALFRLQGRQGQAEAHFREAMRLAPDDGDAYNNLGGVLSEQGRREEAEQAFRRAVAKEPKHAVAWCNLGLVVTDKGMLQEAEKCFRTALEADPAYFYPRVTLAMNELKEVYESDEEIARSRAAYERSLEDLRRRMPQDDAGVAAAADTVGWVTPFFLAYQGHNDRELQRSYGEFVCALMAKRYPALASAAPMPAVDAKPLRIGVVSAFFLDHSVWKNPIRGWIENIDRSRYEIHCYYTGYRDDAETAAARRSCAQFVHGLPFEALAERIRGDRLHALIFPEIGMDPVTVKLAALRLAPVQCNSWGHPITSGMPTIDYYLSSDLMEPPAGDEFYTERLVRLPNLSVHYTPPAYPSRNLRRDEIALRSSAVAFFCAQSLFKYLPRYDEVFARIARQVDDSQFVFISSQHSGQLTEKFRQRVARAFASQGLDAARHVVVLPRMDGATFQAVARASDVFLDSIGWSGCNSALECMAAGLPAITCEGSSMRGRHTYAFLKMMGLDELIAPDVDSYVELAVRVARKPDWRDQLRKETAERLPRIFGDLQCVRGLEAFLHRAVTDPLLAEGD